MAPALWIRRPARAFAALAVIAVVLAGCGGAGHSNASCERFHAGPEYLACINGEPIPTTEKPATNETPSPPVEEEVGGPLSEVGTMTGEVAEATTFREQFQLGPLLYSDEGTPPQPVLDACRFVTAEPEIAASVYARGAVNFTYTKGSLPSAISLGFAEQPVKGEDIQGGGLMAFNVGNEWICDSESDSATLQFQSGESQEIPFWFVGYNVLSNSRPKVPPSIYKTWHFNFLPEHSGSANVMVRGPGAGTACAEEDETGGTYEDDRSLFLFNREGGC
jgi:hypothetical protein